MPVLVFLYSKFVIIYIFELTLKLFKNFNNFFITNFYSFPSAFSRIRSYVSTSYYLILFTNKNVDGYKYSCSTHVVQL